MKLAIAVITLLLPAAGLVGSGSSGEIGRA
jgi:hypothetical protein